MLGVRNLFRPLITDISADRDGWASQTVSTSIRTTVLIAMVAWQVVMLVAVVGTLGWMPWLLVAHVVLIGYATAALRPHVPAWPVPVAQGALAVCTCLASRDLGSVAVFAATWQINFASCAAGLLVLRRIVVPGVVSASIVIAGVMVWRIPAWGWDLPLSTVVTQTSIIVGFRLGLPPLLQLARATDRDEQRAADAARRTEIVQRVSRQVAEEARALHDTAINTLAAISAGGAAIADHHDVRRQCAHDVAVLHALRGERATDTTAHPLDALFEPRGLAVQRGGMDDAGLRRVEATMDPLRLRAVVGCVREAVTNAVKHAGTDRIHVTATMDSDTFVVVVDDDGRGFDNTAIPDRGVANSILRRAADAGVSAEIQSAPGRGTRMKVAAPVHGSALRTQSTAGAFEPVDHVIARLLRQTGSLWAAAMTIVSIVLTLAGGTNHHGALYPMVVVMAAAWFAARRRMRLGVWGAVALTVATAVVFFLAAAATGFGQRGAVHWQAVAATGPAVLLLSYGPPTRWLLAAAGAWASVIAGVAVGVAPSSPNGAGIVLVAGVAGIGCSGALWRFQQVVSSLGGQSAAAQRRALDAEIAADAEAEAQATYRRWLDAGLDDAIALLDGVAGGARHPADPETRRQCGDEETYLRQLVLVSPELVHLGRAMMPTLRVARDRRVRFRLRLGSQDTADEPTAQRVAAEVTSALEATPGGGTVAVSVFPADRGLRLTISGPAVGHHRCGGAGPGVHPIPAARQDGHRGLIQIDVPGRLPLPETTERS